MFESLIDIFPGIQQCVNADLTVMINCTQNGFFWLRQEIKESQSVSFFLSL